MIAPSDARQIAAFVEEMLLAERHHHAGLPNHHSSAGVSEPANQRLNGERPMPPDTDPTTPRDSDTLTGLSAGAHLQQLAAQSITVLSTLIGGWLVTKGISEEQAVSYAETISGIAVGLLGLFAANIWGRIQRSKLLNTPAPTQTVVKAVLPGDPTQSSAGRAVLDAVKKTLPSLLFVVVLLTSIGCASNPSQRLADADRAVTAAATAADSAVKAKLITNPTVLRAMKAAFEQADAVLERAHERFKAGSLADVDVWLDELDAVLLRLAAMQKQSKTEKTADPHTFKEKTSWSSPKSSRSLPSHLRPLVDWSNWPVRLMLA